MRRAVRSLLLLAVLCSVTVMQLDTGGVAAAEQPSKTTTNQAGLINTVSATSYSSYLQSFLKEPAPQLDAFYAGAAFADEQDSGVKKVGSFEGKQDVLEWASEEGWVEWRVEVPETGLYSLGLSYYALPSKGRDIELSLAIDGKQPFDEAARNVFPRVWKNASAIRSDGSGNEIKPDQVEVPMWQDGTFQNMDGLYIEPYCFHLTKGEHTIRLGAVREALAIAGIRVFQETAAQPYRDVMKTYDSQGYKPAANQLLKIQGEQAELKSEPTLFPTYDRSSASTEPANPAKIRLNSVGQLNWQHQGEWMTWEFEVPKDGLYNLAFKVRQNYVRGMYSSRKLFIDGKLPFLEMANVRFPYKLNWYTRVLGDGGKDNEPYLFYLTKGKHELKLEVTPGDLAETLRSVQSVVYEMNDIYRRIIMITGTSVDAYRDYRLDEKIPGLLKQLTRIRTELTKQLANIGRVSSSSGGSEASILEEIIHQLGSFIDNPDTIPNRLERYKNNVSSLGAWILDMRSQPLEIDYIVVKSPDRKAPAARAGFFPQLLFDVRAFFASFGNDASSVGGTYGGSKDKMISVWVSSSDIASTGIATGRDQTQIIRNLIDNSFTPKTGIHVNLSLVDSSQTLVQATLAGKGPDVAMFVPKETPVNLAMRGALADLSTFKGYDELIKRFYKSATIPFEYEGGHYGIPETQDFNMLFYRKDILLELGLKVPATWAEFYKMVPVIQKKNMEIGIPPESQSMFETLLFQRGGTFYTEDRKSTDFDQPAAMEAFKEWTGFYTKYSFPVVFDFYNRFRTGEMPVGIMPYTTYNLLSVAAPELRGLWDIAPIPGSPAEDGSINRMESSNGTGSIILKDSKEQEAAFDFIDWWTSADVQARYGSEQEMLMGAAARYNTANIEAFGKLPWTKAEADNLMNQWKFVWDIPQLPGNYYTSRNITFAFRKVVYDNSNERETLNKYNQEINKEIIRKRAEFHLK
ncbi:ABC-type glycerol-3-phosphate transport system substrate-binding protein [Paenibacillus taihuensis]|uniref:ABC-type glycerol-3-phosphate transport system substrate-binding protein n=1 Tax=Paenibacillus taihuensis TaxID=1156355 RepID=A0A3D9Q6Z8_9BACL|nr:extracellular solute-binding protein [Paenibacillus taihuensis]REE56453.1 ABC-type glycerol-3-phosphate transport system substrate-binding protein [Paenibacillus taihuensis]